VAEVILAKQALRLREHRHNLKEELLEKLKLSQNNYEQSHRVGWDEARILKIENNSRHRNTRNRTI
jgi:hypothetical protein